MHIVLLTQSLRGGGAEQVCLNWAEAMSSSGHDVTVLALRTADSPQQLARMAAAGIRVETMPAKARSPLAKVRHIREYVLRRGPQVLVSLLTFPNLLALAAARRTDCAVVISEHNVPTILLGRQGVSQKLQRRLARRTYATADHVIAVSHAVAADLATGYGIKGMYGTVLPNSVFGNRPSHEALISAPPQRIRLVAPARLTAQKRPEFALRVADELSERGHDVTIRFIGDRSPDRKSLVLSSDKSEVISVPWDSGWATALEPGSIVLLASDVEGFGNVLVESAAAGYPTVAGSWALGVADAIIPGVTGDLARSDTVESYADAVERANGLSSGAGIDGWLSQFSRESAASQLDVIVRAARERRIGRRASK